LLFGFLVGGVRPAEAAELLELEFLRGGLLVFRGRIIALLANSAGERDDVSHGRSSESLGKGYGPWVIGLNP
jgi:hypothetical protein